MRHPHFFPLLPVLFPVLAAVALLAVIPTTGAAQGSDSADAPGSPAAELIVLVRHAETAPDGTRDPALSEAGLGRAGRLAAFLEDAAFTDVLTSPYRRTRQTAAAVAGSVGIEPESYDPRALERLARDLLARPGRHLVVGHSNTTPMLVELLGGEAGPPIDEDEHGRIYVLVPADGEVRTLVLRY